jgi:hypothetical protein
MMDDALCGACPVVLYVDTVQGNSKNREKYEKREKKVKGGSTLF